MILVWLRVGNILVYSQENLILNPSGEEASYIPYNIAKYDAAINWWQINTYGSPDYYTSLNDSTCRNHIPNNRFGTQEANHGNYYFGIGNFDWDILSSQTGECFHCRVEYLGGLLRHPLEKGKTYLFEFWMSKADSLYLISNAFDLFLAYNAEIDVYDFDNYADYGHIIWSEETPFTEKEKWVKISACFKAKGGEKAFALGNFHNLADIELIYPYPEEVSVDYRYLDNFSLIECPTCCPEQFPVEDQLSLFSNSAMDGIPPSLEMWLIPNSTGSLRIYDSAGRLVAEEQYTALQNNYTFNNYAAGIYHYFFTTDLGYMEYGKVLVHE